MLIAFNMIYFHCFDAYIQFSKGDLCHSVDCVRHGRRPMNWDVFILLIYKQSCVTSVFKMKFFSSTRLSIPTPYILHISTFTPNNRRWLRLWWWIFYVDYFILAPTTWTHIIWCGKNHHVFLQTIRFLVEWGLNKTSLFIRLKIQLTHIGTGDKSVI